MFEGVVLFAYNHKLSAELLQNFINRIMFSYGIINSVHQIMTDNFLVVTFMYMEGKNENEKISEVIAEDFLIRLRMVNPEVIFEWASMEKTEEKHLNETDLVEAFHKDE